MNKSANLIMALGLCLFCMMSAQAQRLPDPNQPQGAGVQMTLTHLSVTDQNFEMGWKIVNNTDHDVWFCDSATDWFMDADNETLVIRRRYNISNAGVIWEGPPYPRFWYSRLRPGEQKVKSIARAVPIEPRFLFKVSQGNAEHARRVALEIGYYDEDLRALILEIVNVRDKLGCDGSAISFPVPQSTQEVYNRFFGGVRIARWFDSPTASYFRDSVTSGGDEIIAPYLNQALHGEQVLRLEVENVSIPFGTKYYPPLVAAEEPSGVTPVLTKLDVNDTNLELGWKIVNNTDHEVWFCDSATDWFMDADSETLVIRRRYNISNTRVIWEIPPFPRFRYSRLRPGEQKVKSVARPVPVETDARFDYPLVSADHAKRVAVEIGYYDEDLRALILEIVNVAEKLGCDGSAISGSVPQSTEEVYNRFFGGVRIALLFNSAKDFRDSVTSGGDEIIAPYFSQALHGEQVLRLEVDNVSIPFGTKYYPPLAGQ